MDSERVLADTTALVQGWFSVTAMEPGVFQIGEPLHEEDVNSTLVVGADRAVLIDTGMGIGDLSAVVASLTDRPVQVVNSHAHWDHIGANWRYDQIAIHAAEADRLPVGVGSDRIARAFTARSLTGPLPEGTDVAKLTIPPSRATTILLGGETFDLGGRTLEVIHAPGHSPGGIVLLDRANGVLFSTDVAYPGPLYAFSDDVDFAVYQRTMTALADLAPSLRIAYPSHNGASMSPDLLPKMRDALNAIAEGRVPESIDGGIAHHQFTGFSVLARAN
jgi:glyoxylase-like metal-dependent hydrolase (beta-lactamase superfamily II)